MVDKPNPHDSLSRALGHVSLQRHLTRGGCTPRRPHAGMTERNHRTTVFDRRAHILANIIISPRASLSRVNHHLLGVVAANENAYYHVSAVFNLISRRSLLDSCGQPAEAFIGRATTQLCDHTRSFRPSLRWVNNISPRGPMEKWNFGMY
ncbi:hypothetical protein BJX96DRAFT_156047 [Aspergillus floccosus]